MPYFGVADWDRACATADERECAPVGLKASLDDAAVEINGAVIDWRGQKAWNFGLNVFDLDAWRAQNATEKYAAWISANQRHGWFPDTSLAYVCRADPPLTNRGDAARIVRGDGAGRRRRPRRG